MRHLLIVKVLEGNWNLVFSLLIENYFEGASVIVDFKQSAHGLFLFGNYTTHNYDLYKFKSDTPSETNIQLSQLSFYGSASQIGKETKSVVQSTPIGNLPR